MLRLAICAALLASPVQAETHVGTVRSVVSSLLIFDDAEVLLADVIPRDVGKAGRVLAVLTEGEVVRCEIRGESPAGYALGHCRVGALDLGRALVDLDLAAESCSALGRTLGRC